MQVAIDVESLKRVPILAGLSAAQLRHLAELAEIEDFRAGELILEQGQMSQNLWIVLEGKCEIVKRLSGQSNTAEPTMLAVIEPNGHFGEMSFFQSAPHSASVRAQTDVRVYRLGRGRFEELVTLEPSAAYQLAFNTIESLAERVRRTSEWVAELMAANVAGPQVPEWRELRRKMFHDGWNL